MSKAVFLDRDGTIIEDCGYLYEPSRVMILPTVVEGLKLLMISGFELIVISNQSGIARGLFDFTDIYAVEKRINGLLLHEGIVLNAYYYCPHCIKGMRSEYAVECTCRKPGIGLALKAKCDHDIDLENSYMIGDKNSDVMFGKNFNARASVLVRTGCSGDFINTGRAAPDFIASSFYEAAVFIISMDSKVHA